jgi:galactose mutarotase-like enzyme
MRHLAVDDNGLPTGDSADWAGGTQVLADTDLDDGFDQVPEGAVFAISAGDRRVAVTFEKGYPAAQMFAPAKADLIGLEPMAAPTDALRRGTYKVAAPGKPETATFSIRVS